MQAIILERPFQIAKSESWKKITSLELSDDFKRKIATTFIDAAKIKQFISF